MRADIYDPIAALQVIDNHCHLFLLEYVSTEPAQLLTMSLNDMPGEQLRQTLVYRRMLLELRRLFKNDGTEAEVLQEREGRMKGDFAGYVETLFRDARIHTLLVDLGYKPAAVSLEHFEKIVPARVRYIYRIEGVLDELWDELNQGRIEFGTAEERFDQTLEQALKQPGMVALKSIIGYRTGLEIGTVKRSDLIRDKPDEKVFRDYFLARAVLAATDAGLPVQIHAAFGESNIDVLKNNPGLFKAFLDRPEHHETRFVLVHGGYPYSFEAAYLASVYPHVYVDLSEMIPFAPRGLRRGLSTIFDMCPFNKILYGSDGFVIPDIHWLGAKMAKEALAGLLSKLIDEGLFDRDLALQVGRQVFYETARDLYALPH